MLRRFYEVFTKSDICCLQFNYFSAFPLCASPSHMSLLFYLLFTIIVNLIHVSIHSPSHPTTQAFNHKDHAKLPLKLILDKPAASHKGTRDCNFPAFFNVNADTEKYFRTAGFYGTGADKVKCWISEPLKSFLHDPRISEGALDPSKDLQNLLRMCRFNR